MKNKKKTYIRLNQNIDSEGIIVDEGSIVELLNLSPKGVSEIETLDGSRLNVTNLKYILIK